MLTVVDVDDDDDADGAGVEEGDANSMYFQSKDSSGSSSAVSSMASLLLSIGSYYWKRSYWDSAWNIVWRSEVSDAIVGIRVEDCTWLVYSNSCDL